MTHPRIAAAREAAQRSPKTLGPGELYPAAELFGARRALAERDRSPVPPPHLDVEPCDGGVVLRVLGWEIVMDPNAVDALVEDLITANERAKEGLGV